VSRNTSDDEYEKRYMLPGESIVAREKVVSRGAFRISLIFLGVFGLGGLVALIAMLLASAPLPLILGSCVPMILLGVAMGVLGAMFSVYRVMVTATHLHVHFGWAKKKIPMSAISEAREVESKGFKQGKVSVGLDGVVRTVVGTSKSRRAVEVTYQEEGGRKNIMTIGLEDPQRILSALSPGGRVRVSAPAADVEEEVVVEEDESKLARR